MSEKNEKLGFASDYMEGAHPMLLERLVETNMVSCAGYGADAFSESARVRIRRACEAPEAEIFFLAGGTQANAVVLGALLRPYQGVIAAATGHIATHEAGAIEHGGHKVIELAHDEGKLQASDVATCFDAWKADDNREHMVMPGAVYISQPTEYGTLYSLDELAQLSAVCRENGAALYLDGARLAYALATPTNDAGLADIARLCDAFYIGGTKCGALLGEAVVFPTPGLVPGFFSIVKQNGALLAKGRVAGVQFDALFTDGLYQRIGQGAIAAADRIREALERLGYEQTIASPTNQIFVALEQRQLDTLSQQVELSFWEHLADGRTVMRIATSWATQEADVDALIGILEASA